MKKFLFAGLLLVCGVSVVYARTPVTVVTQTWETVVSAFRQVKTVTAPVSPVPQVIEVSFDSDIAERFSFAVLNTASREFVGNLFVDQSSSSNVPLVVSSSNGLNPGKMIDNNTQTYAEFALPVNMKGQGQGLADITVIGEQPFTLSSITLVLDNHVALPTSISVSALVNGVSQTVLAPVPMKQSSVVFPKTTSARWTITLVYSQPLRITELVLPQEGGIHVQDRYLRFLAQSGVTYKIYFDPDRNVSINTPESANLRDDQGVYRMNASAISNTLFTPADVDGDGIIDVFDNCTSLANTDQVDIDGNGRGDVCDDFDKDSVQNSVDNCPETPNRDQRDIDGDKIGDMCDGEESRFTEKYAWFPWVGIGFAGLVLVVLFISVLGMSKNTNSIDTPQV